MLTECPNQTSRGWRRASYRLVVLVGVLVLSGGGVREPAVATAYRGTVPVFPDMAETKKIAAQKAFARQCTERQKVFAPPAVIQARGLTKKYKKRHFFTADEEVTALDDITADLKGPQSIAVVGDQDAGKTTFLKCLAGLEEPTAGSVTVTGLRKAVYVGRELRSMTGRTVRELLRSTVAEYLPGKNLRNIEIVTDTILSATELNTCTKTQDRDLSGSEVYRFAIAMALAEGCAAPTPPVLILDNIFDRADRRIRRAVQWTLFDLQRDWGIMLLFTAYDHTVVLEIARQMAEFKDGRIVEVAIRERSRYVQYVFEKMRMDLMFKADQYRRRAKGDTFSLL